MKKRIEAYRLMMIMLLSLGERESEKNCVEDIEYNREVDFFWNVFDA
jgi:hypothetical protein